MPEKSLWPGRAHLVDGRVHGGGGIAGEEWAAGEVAQEIVQCARGGRLQRMVFSTHSFQFANWLMMNLTYIFATSAELSPSASHVESGWHLDVPEWFLFGVLL